MESDAENDAISIVKTRKNCGTEQTNSLIKVATFPLLPHLPRASQVVPWMSPIDFQRLAGVRGLIALLWACRFWGLRADLAQPRWPGHGKDAGEGQTSGEEAPRAAQIRD